MNLQVIKFDSSINLRESDLKFIQCIKKAPKPITEQFIVTYYINNINRDKGDEWRYDFNLKDYTWKPKDKGILRSMALQWFDRNLGKLIRKGVVNYETTLRSDQP